MAEMMWAGRSSQGVDSRVNAFNSSTAFRRKNVQTGYPGSIAHATMLGEQGIISMSDSLELIRRSQGDPCGYRKRKAPV